MEDLTKVGVKETKRKRAVPNWMKSPPKLVDGSTDVMSPTRKAQRTSYPPISIHKVKKSPKRVDGMRLKTDKPSDCNMRGPPHMSPKEKDRAVSSTDSTYGTTLQGLNKTTSPESNTALEDFCLTVEELTKVAQEVIQEERKKIRLSMLKKSQKKIENP